MEFKDLPIGAIFNYNGNSYSKVDDELSVTNFHSNDTACPTQFIERYLNNQFLIKNNINTEDVNLFEDGRALRLMSIAEHDKWYRLIPKWNEQYVADDLKTCFQYNLTTGESKVQNPYYGPKQIRAVVKFKLSTEVEYVRTICSEGITCSVCGKVIKNDDFETISYADTLNNQAYCENCFVDYICKDMTPEEKILIAKRALDKACEQSFFRTGNKSYSYLKEQYDIYKKQTGGK